MKAFIHFFARDTSIVHPGLCCYAINVSDSLDALSANIVHNRAYYGAV